MSLFLSVDAGSLLNEFLANFSLERLLPAVLVAVLCIVVIKILLVIVDRVLKKADQVDSTVKKLIRLMLKAVFLFIAIIIVLACLGIPVTSLIAVLSVFGLAISLAVQNFLSNVAGGLQLAASKPFKEGDYVEAGGCSGTILEVGLFYTKLNSPDKKLIQIPNSAIVASNIINYSSEDIRRVELNVSVSYDTSIDKVKEVMGRLVGEHPLTLTTPAHQVSVVEYGDSAIKVTVRAWCANQDYWTVYFDVMDAMKPELEKNGVHFTYPHVNVHMTKE